MKLPAIEQKSLAETVFAPALKLCAEKLKPLVVSIMMMLMMASMMMRVLMMMIMMMTMMLMLIMGC